MVIPDKNKITIPDYLIGPSPNPNDMPESVYQGYEDTCAIRSQEIILRDYGINVSQEELIQLSFDQGWYKGNGTQLEDVGNILDHYGIETERHTQGNIYNLLDELAQGHRVIVGVDGTELVKESGFGHDIMEFLGIKTPNHALVVSAIDANDPDNLKVIVTDPGTGDVAKVYTREEFEDAWDDSNCFYATTNKPAPNLPFFNYENGSYDNFLPMSHDQFHNTYLPLMDKAFNLEQGEDIYSLGASDAVDDFLDDSITPPNDDNDTDVLDSLDIADVSVTPDDDDVDFLNDLV